MGKLPDGLWYSENHVWVRPLSDGASVRIGLTDFAQEALGEVVYVSIPDVGSSVTAGEAFGEVESLKVLNDLVSPVTGTIGARNGEVADDPTMINAEPYGAGWLAEIKLAARSCQPSYRLPSTPP